MKIKTPRGREFEPAALRRAYRQLSPIIIADLAELCLADESVFAQNDRDTCVNIGKHMIWLHINRFLNLDQQQIEDIYAGRGAYISHEVEDE